MLSLHLQLDSFTGDLAIESISLGSFQELFPDCGLSESQCGNSYSNNVSVTQYSSEIDEEPTNDSGVNIVYIGLIGFVVSCCILAIILVFAIIFVIVKRKHFQKIPQPEQL